MAAAAVRVPVLVSSPPANGSPRRAAAAASSTRTQRWTRQRIFAGTFFHEYAVLQQPQLETREQIQHVCLKSGAARLKQAQRATPGPDKVYRRKFPIRKRTVDDLESQSHPLH